MIIVSMLLDRTCMKTGSVHGGCTDKNSDTSVRNRRIHVHPSFPIYLCIHEFIKRMFVHEVVHLRIAPQQMLDENIPIRWAESPATHSVLDNGLD
jgi:hypothetical protein